MADTPNVSDGSPESAAASMQNDDETSHCDEIEFSIEKTREELRKLRETRLNLEAQRRKELQDANHAFARASKELGGKLSTTSLQSINAYLGMLRESQSKVSDATPMYVLRQEASLLQAMHMTFLVLPTQEAIVKRQHDELTDYLRDELATQSWGKQEAEQRVVATVSKVAQGNNNLYDDYQRQLDKLKRQIRELREQVKLTYNSKCSNNEDIMNEKLLPQHHKHEHLLWDEITMGSTNHSETSLEEEDAAWFHNLSLSKLQDSFSNSFKAVSWNLPSHHNHHQQPQISR